MRVPLHWLREYCDPTSTCAAIEERLTMTGTKVEAIHHHGVALDRAASSSGACSSAEPHPDADRLRVCKVDVGDGRAARRSSAARRTSPPGRPSRSRGPAR